MSRRAAAVRSESPSSPASRSQQQQSQSQSQQPSTLTGAKEASAAWTAVAAPTQSVKDQRKIYALESLRYTAGAQGAVNPAAANKDSAAVDAGEQVRPASSGLAQPSSSSSSSHSSVTANLALSRQVTCECSDCVRLNEFLRSQRRAVSFDAPSYRRAHLHNMINDYIGNNLVSHQSRWVESVRTLHVEKIFDRRHEILTRRAEQVVRDRMAAAEHGTVSETIIVGGLHGKPQSDQHASQRGMSVADADAINRLEKHIQSVSDGAIAHPPTVAELAPAADTLLKVDAHGNPLTAEAAAALSASTLSAMEALDSILGSSISALQPHSTAETLAESLHNWLKALKLHSMEQVVTEMRAVAIHGPQSRQPIYLQNSSSAAAANSAASASVAYLIPPFADIPHEKRLELEEMLLSTVRSVLRSYHARYLSKELRMNELGLIDPIANRVRIETSFRRNFKIDLDSGVIKRLIIIQMNRENDKQQQHSSGVNSIGGVEQKSASGAAASERASLQLSINNSTAAAAAPRLPPMHPSFYRDNTTDGSLDVVPLPSAVPRLSSVEEAESAASASAAAPSKSLTVTFAKQSSSKKAASRGGSVTSRSSTQELYREHKEKEREKADRDQQVAAQSRKLHADLFKSKFAVAAAAAQGVAPATPIGSGSSSARAALVSKPSMSLQSAREPAITVATSKRVLEEGQSLLSKLNMMANPAAHAASAAAANVKNSEDESKKSAWSQSQKRESSATATAQFGALSLLASSSVTDDMHVSVRTSISSPRSPAPAADSLPADVRSKLEQERQLAAEKRAFEKTLITRKLKLESKYRKQIWKFLDAHYLEESAMLKQEISLAELFKVREQEQEQRLMKNASRTLQTALNAENTAESSALVPVEGTVRRHHDPAIEFELQSLRDKFKKKFVDPNGYSSTPQKLINALDSDVPQNLSFFPSFDNLMPISLRSTQHLQMGDSEISGRFADSTPKLLPEPIIVTLHADQCVSFTHPKLSNELGIEALFKESFYSLSCARDIDRQLLNQSIESAAFSMVHEELEETMDVALQIFLMNQEMEEAKDRLEDAGFLSSPSSPRRVFFPNNGASLSPQHKQQASASDSAAPSKRGSVSSFQTPSSVFSSPLTSPAHRSDLASPSKSSFGRTATKKPAAAAKSSASAIPLPLGVSASSVVETLARMQKKKKDRTQAREEKDREDAAEAAAKLEEYQNSDQYLEDQAEKERAEREAEEQRELEAAEAARQVEAQKLAAAQADRESEIAQSMSLLSPHAAADDTDEAATEEKKQEIDALASLAHQLGGSDDEWTEENKARLAELKKEVAAEDEKRAKKHKKHKSSSSKKSKKKHKRKEHAITEGDEAAHAAVSDSEHAASKKHKKKKHKKHKKAHGSASPKGSGTPRRSRRPSTITDQPAFQLDPTAWLLEQKALQATSPAPLAVHSSSSDSNSDSSSDSETETEHKTEATDAAAKAKRARREMRKLQRKEARAAKDSKRKAAGEKKKTKKPQLKAGKKSAAAGAHSSSSSAVSDTEGEESKDRAIGHDLAAALMSASPSGQSTVQHAWAAEGGQSQKEQRSKDMDVWIQKQQARMKAREELFKSMFNQEEADKERQLMLEHQIKLQEQNKPVTGSDVASAGAAQSPTAAAVDTNSQHSSHASLRSPSDINASRSPDLSGHTSFAALTAVEVANQQRQREEAYMLRRKQLAEAQMVELEKMDREKRHQEKLKAHEEKQALKLAAKKQAALEARRLELEAARAAAAAAEAAGQVVGPVPEPEVLDIIVSDVTESEVSDSDVNSDSSLNSIRYSSSSDADSASQLNSDVEAGPSASVDQQDSYKSSDDVIAGEKWEVDPASASLSPAMSTTDMSKVFPHNTAPKSATANASASAGAHAATTRDSHARSLSAKAKLKASIPTDPAYQVLLSAAFAATNAVLDDERHRLESAQQTADGQLLPHSTQQHAGVTPLSPGDLRRELQSLMREQAKGSEADKFQIEPQKMQPLVQGFLLWKQQQKAQLRAVEKNNVKQQAAADAQADASFVGSVSSPSSIRSELEFLTNELRDCFANELRQAVYSERRSGEKAAKRVRRARHEKHLVSKKERQQRKLLHAKIVAETLQQMDDEHRKAEETRRTGALRMKVQPLGPQIDFSLLANAPSASAPSLASAAPSLSLSTAQPPVTVSTAASSSLMSTALTSGDFVHSSSLPSSYSDPDALYRRFDPEQFRTQVIRDAQEEAKLAKEEMARAQQRLEREKVAWEEAESKRVAGLSAALEGGAMVFQMSLMTRLTELWTKLKIGPKQRLEFLNKYQQLSHAPLLLEVLTLHERIAAAIGERERLLANAFDFLTRFPPSKGRLRNISNEQRLAEERFLRTLLGNIKLRSRHLYPLLIRLRTAYQDVLYFGVAVEAADGAPSLAPEDNCLDYLHKMAIDTALVHNMCDPDSTTDGILNSPPNDSLVSWTRTGLTVLPTVAGHFLQAIARRPQTSGKGIVNLQAPTAVPMLLSFDEQLKLDYLLENQVEYQEFLRMHHASFTQPPVRVQTAARRPSSSFHTHTETHSRTATHVETKQVYLGMDDEYQWQLEQEAAGRPVGMPGGDFLVPKPAWQEQQQQQQQQAQQQSYQVIDSHSRHQHHEVASTSAEAFHTSIPAAPVHPFAYHLNAPGSTFYTQGPEATRARRVQRLRTMNVPQMSVISVNSYYAALSNMMAGGLAPAAAVQPVTTTITHTRTQTTTHTEKEEISISHHARPAASGAAATPRFHPASTIAAVAQAAASKSFAFNQSVTLSLPLSNAASHSIYASESNTTYRIHQQQHRQKLQLRHMQTQKAAAAQVEEKQTLQQQQFLFSSPQSSATFHRTQQTQEVEEERHELRHADGSKPAPAQSHSHTHTHTRTDTHSHTHTHTIVHVPVPVLMEPSFIAPIANDNSLTLRSMLQISEEQEYAMKRDELLKEGRLDELQREEEKMMEVAHREEQQRLQQQQREWIAAQVRLRLTQTPASSTLAPQVELLNADAAAEAAAAVEADNDDDEDDADMQQILSAAAATTNASKPSVWSGDSGVAAAGGSVIPSSLSSSRVGQQLAEAIQWANQNRFPVTERRNTRKKRIKNAKKGAAPPVPKKIAMPTVFASTSDSAASAVDGQPAAAFSHPPTLQIGPTAPTTSRTTARRPLTRAEIDALASAAFEKKWQQKKAELLAGRSIAIGFF